MNTQNWKRDCSSKTSISQNMMLVDVGHNDVGKVSEYVSVNPQNIMQVKRCSHVIHTSSTTMGTLCAGLARCSNVLRSTPQT